MLAYIDFAVGGRRDKPDQSLSDVQPCRVVVTLTFFSPSRETLVKKNFFHPSIRSMFVTRNRKLPRDYCEFKGSM